jgi:flagellar protein FlgJ
MDKLNAAAALAPAVAKHPTAKTGGPSAQKTAHEFEAVFIGQMTQMMMETVESDGTFSGGHGEEMFRGVLAEKLGTAITKRGGIGIAPLVMDQIIKLQGGSR